MKKVYGTILFSSIFCVASLAQFPSKEWDYTFGGSSQDDLQDMQRTADGGYILAGTSSSMISGDKSQPNLGQEDYWIVKIDSLGIKEWDKDFGGSKDDELRCIRQTSDGGYILAGHSNSPAGGNKTEGNWDTTGITNDFWVVKINALGDEEWDKVFGGTDNEYLYSAEQTADGGYLFAGVTLSGVSGNKETPNWTNIDGPSLDYWVVKTDAFGNMEWEKNIGGTDADYLSTAQQTLDGGYIVGGRSQSGITGNKTQPAWSGLWDYWIVKLNSSGVIQWDKDIGGTGFDLLTCLLQTPDNGYLLGGSTSSDATGDKTQATFGYFDYWIVKIDDAGNKQWDRDFGGVDDDRMLSMLLTNDGEFILAGQSNSGIGGNKSETTRGDNDYWMVITDAMGNKLWDKDFGGILDDNLRSVVQSWDGGYLLGGYSGSGIGGDKTQAPQGGTDYWIVKLSPDSLNAIENVSLKGEDFKLYPNPAQNFITIDYSGINEEINSVSIKNIFGQTLLMYKDIPLYRLEISMTSLSSAVYWVEISKGNKRILKKLLVQDCR